MTGRVHSVQSLGAVDGPGVRYVIFMQGCPLRCAYCHNPDTWDAAGGEEFSVDALAQKALRCRPYWGKNGGVTVSGGEPLLQAPFVAELFEKLHEYGVHTALDTSGIGNLADAARVLRHTDLVLCDIKFLDAPHYARHCGGDFAAVRRFLQCTATMAVPLWVRHVVVPNWTDTVEQLRAVKAMAEGYPNLEKLEFLPFHKLCLEKYERMGLPFPLADTPAMNPETLDALVAAL